MIHVIINPSGAGGAAKQTWSRVRSLLRERKISFRAHFSERTCDIDELVRNVCETYEEQQKLSEVPREWADDVLTLIVIGGDGTMNLAVNGITDFDRVRVGLIPCGSGNDMARSLGITKQAETELEKIVKGEVRRRLDVGEVRYYNRFNENDGSIPDAAEYTRLFNISCGIGFDAAVCYEVSVTKVKDLLNKIRLGKLCYLAAAIKTVFTAERLGAVIDLDGRQIACEKLLFAACMNEPYEGGGFRFGPRADAGDGIMDLCIIDGVNNGAFFRIFPTAYKGNHTKFKGVDVYTGREIEVRTEKPMWVHTDGEIEYKSTHVAVRFLEKKLQLLN